MRVIFASLVLLSAFSLAADDPHLDAASIVSAADHRGGKVSPGEIIVLYPSNAGPDVLMGEQLDEHGRVATSLAGTRVLFDGLPAPVAYTVRGEVGAVVPYEVAGRATTNIVVEYEGRQSAPVIIPVSPSAPALFTQNRIGTGQAGVLNDTGCCNSPANPAVRGEVITVYGTGEGLLNGHVATGSISAYKTVLDYPRPRLPVRLTVGGARAEILFVGAAPHAVAGLLQVNFRVPKDAPMGDAVPLVLSIGDAISSPDATIAVRAAKEQILVAESDSSAGEWLKQVLTKAGYEVYLDNDAEAVIEGVRTRPVDLVVMGLRGTAVEHRSWVNAMREARPRLRVLAAVDAVEADTLRDADLTGAQAVVVRPFSSKVLISRVRDLLRRHPPIYEAGDPLPLPGPSR
jgi:uncharacterized protein (TIGR03437 family)